MELRQLRYFLAVADCRSFVGAASKLYITRQAVSKAVSQLESEVNAELFMRDSNGAFLTPAGVKFYDRIRPLVAEMDQVRQEMQTYGHRYYQRIRIAFSVGTMPPFEDRLIEYRRREENTEIEYQEVPEAEALRLLREQQADLMISATPSEDPLLISEPFFSSPLGVLIRKTRTLEDVATLTCRDLVWLPLAIHSDIGLGDFCRKNTLTPQFQGYDFRRLFDLASKGQCALLLPQCLVPEIRTDLLWIPIERVGEWTLCLTYHKSMEQNSLYSAAVDHLCQNVLQTGADVPKILPRVIE